MFLCVDIFELFVSGNVTLCVCPVRNVGKKLTWEVLEHPWEVLGRACEGLGVLGVALGRASGDLGVKSKSRSRLGFP